MRIPDRDRRVPSAPEGAVIYAVGDIHGRLDLLAAATEELERRTAGPSGCGRCTIVFLGDYVDRGPSSAAVIDHLIGLTAKACFEPIFLRGNHEQSMLDAAAGHPSGVRWLDHGGRETLASYGVDIPRGANPTIERLQAAVAKSVPREHIAFLSATEIYRKLGDYIFVHAGLRPDRLLEEQSVSDMLGLRHPGDEPPLWSETVVHGHSPHPRPVAGRWHIGIDTGAHDMGALTLLRLDGVQRCFLKVAARALAEPACVTPWEAVDRDTPSSPEPPRGDRGMVELFKDRWMVAAESNGRRRTDAARV